ncbi:hypothetical protein [Actinoplanes sp. NPDC020271]
MVQLLLAVAGLVVFYLVIRLAVAHGIADADIKRRRDGRGPVT